MANSLKPYYRYGISEQERCWLVSLQRYDKRWVKAFAFSIYGGRDQALRAAQAWRDQVMSEHPPMLRRDKAERPRRDNKSGIPGVVSIVGKDGAVERWLAKTYLAREGRVLQKSFRISQYGEDAREMAIAERHRQLDQLHGRLDHHAAFPSQDRPEQTSPPARPMAAPRAQFVRKNNRSGYPGVSLARSRDGTPVAWTACTQLGAERRLRARFAIKKYGQELALALAIQERQRQLQALDGDGG